MEIIFDKRKVGVLFLLALLALSIVFFSPLTAKRVAASEPDRVFTFYALNVTYSMGYSSSGSYLNTSVSDNIYHVSTGKYSRAYDPDYGRMVFYILDVTYLFNVSRLKSTIPNTSKIEVNAEARTNVATTQMQTVELSIFNYRLGYFQQIASFYGTTVDAWLSWIDAVNPLDYMDSQGNMQLNWGFCALQPDFTRLWIDFQCIKLTLKPFKWTFMVYMDSDWSFPGEYQHPIPGDLFSRVDIDEMEMAGSTSEVAVIVQVDWYQGGAYRYFITQDFVNGTRVSPKLMYLGEVNMGNPSTLTNFVNWTIANYPSERYALTIWDHGQGVRGTCWDEHPEDYLDMVEFKTALADAKAATGKQLNLVGFMACVMQMAEVGYQIKDYADVMVASEEVIYIDIGWRFDWILSDLAASPTMTGVQLGQVIVDEYQAAAAGWPPNDPAPPTMSSVDLTRSGYLAARIDEFAAILSSKLSTYRSQIEACKNSAETFYDPDFIDLYNFTQNTLSISDPAIMNAANALLNEIDQTVLCEWHASGTDAHGVSIYFPRYYSYDAAMYGPLNMSLDYRWDEFLKAYLNIQ